MGRRKDQRQLNVPLDPDIWQKLEELYAKLGRSKSGLVKDALRNQYGWGRAGEETDGFALTMREVLENVFLKEREPLRYRVLLGEELELVHPVSVAVKEGGEFRFKLGEGIVRAHRKAIEKLGVNEPVRCRIRIFSGGEEIATTEELGVDVSEGDIEALGEEERVIPFPTGLEAHVDETLTWKLETRFKRVRPLRDEIMDLVMEREARFRVVSEDKLKLAEFISLAYKALAYMYIGLYAEAEEMCREAVRYFPEGEKLGNLILAEIYRRRALGITAEGESPSEEIIDRFAETYNNYLEKISKGRGRDDMGISN